MMIQYAGMPCATPKDGDYMIQSFRNEYAFLSNFYPCAVRFEKRVFQSAEAAFQSAKCLYEEDKDKFCHMDAATAKRQGRLVQLSPFWEARKLDVMERVVYAKFSANPSLATLLLQTKDEELIEGNLWHDVFWGVDSRTGEGFNHLGKILMRTRELLRWNPDLE